MSKIIIDETISLSIKSSSVSIGKKYFRLNSNGKTFFGASSRGRRLIGNISKLFKFFISTYYFFKTKGLPSTRILPTFPVDDFTQSRLKAIIQEPACCLITWLFPRVNSYLIWLNISSLFV